MSYTVIKSFHDLTDKNGGNYHFYSVGDTYPRRGKKPGEKRIKELLGADNAQGTPLIKEKENDKPRKD